MKAAKAKLTVNRPLTKSSNSFPVVGIGASSGGFDAFKKLLKAIPENSGMAFVLVQHLEPSRESLLPDLLQKVTRIPVLEISANIKVEPDHIYIIPSNKILIANNGVLQLSPRPTNMGTTMHVSGRERNLPIDLFFTSLAEVHQSNAIGVVLSGIKSDGTKGLKAIKNKGGITFAQNDATAAYEGMPHSEVNAGVVDFILPPEEIPKKLLEVVKTFDKKLSNGKSPAARKEVFKQILLLLRIHKRTDFTYYKQTTIERRILRRISLGEHKNSIAYLNYLKENKAEQDLLYQDLLIPVTSFFRDAQTFDRLCNTIFPSVINNKSDSEPIRIWIAGCSTGEEVYTFAICFNRLKGETSKKIQIFATDLSEPAIAKARSGFYTKKELSDVSTSDLKEFFIKTSGGYQVAKSIREICVFTVHDFLTDPPFSHIDIISCRNVLIYMESYLQKKAFTIFHYALNPKGHLLLGKTESTNAVPDLFATVTKKDKLFSRKDLLGNLRQVTRNFIAQSTISHALTSKKEIISNDFQKEADDVILNKYAPSSVIVNDAFDIVYFRGSTSRYLEQASGTPSHNLMKLAKHSLAFELRSVLNKAKMEKATVSKNNILLKISRDLCNVSIEVTPLLASNEPHYLIVFKDTVLPGTKVLPRTTKKSSSGTLKNNRDNARIIQLENQLAQNNDDMRSITEDQDLINQELQSSNEELLSSSEELQSLNEELETRKEELQNAIEELTIVNHETLNLNEHLTIATRRIQDSEKRYNMMLMQSPFAFSILKGKDMVITLANDSIKEAWGKGRDVEGKSLFDVFPEIKDQAFPELLYKVYTTGIPFHANEILARLERNGTLEDVYFNLLYQPYREVDETISGVTVIAVEVTQEVIAKNRNLEYRKLKEKELEEKVQQRTVELRMANELTEQKNVELEIMNKELNSFTYVSSHDLQEPLRKIQAFSNLILEKESQNLTDKAKDYFKRMQSASARMQNLIEDLLAFSRLNTTERKFENTDLNKIIEQVESELTETISEKKATIEITELCEAYIIPFQFRQLMLNLIGNALKFSKPELPPHIIIGSSNIICSVENDNKLVPGKEYCHITVKDNGIGFEPHFSKRIFEVFQRLHGKDEYKGTGIGLAIVKKIVENHNGIITATSEINEGATFEIYIPVSPGS